MTKEFQERLEGFTKDEELFLALSDYDILGEELALIKAMGEQLKLYSDIISHNGSYKEGMHIQVSLNALWGLGTMITKVSEQMKGKINVLDERYDVKVRKKTGG